MWLACVISHLCRQHNPRGFRVFVSSTDFGHKSWIIVLRFLSIIFTQSESTLFFTSSSVRGSKVSFIHKQRTGQTKQRNLERLTWDLPALGQASGSCLPANVNCQKIHVIMSVIGNKENYVWRLSLNVFLIGSNVLLKITFLKIGFILVQRENENSVSVVNEKRVVGAVKLKEGHQLTYRLLQTMVEWPFIKLRFWKLLVSTNCDIHYVIKILPNIRYNGLNYAYNIEI